MDDIFITSIHVDKVRNIENFDIPLSETERKHLLITGKNGSGKTSLLLEINADLNNTLCSMYSNKNSGEAKTLKLGREPYSPKVRIDLNNDFYIKKVCLFF